MDELRKSGYPPIYFVMLDLLNELWYTVNRNYTTAISGTQ